MAASCRCSSVVFVGNIPYQASEEELRAACEEIGPVVSLRVAADRDSGRPRGFAFCEYLDDETALSACRNLNGRFLRGRELRVRLADRTAVPSEHQPVGVQDATHAATLVSCARPRGAVTAYLAGLSRRQLRELLEVVGTQDPGLVEWAKREYAGLATLIEQAQVLLDMASAPDGDKKGQAPKRRRLEDGKSASGVACR